MGIKNLISYLTNAELIKDHNLQNTSVVIDGDNTFWTLYRRYNLSRNGIDFKFGGNYHHFGQCCRLFFESLAKCGIRSIVVMDGKKTAKTTDSCKEPHLEDVVRSKKFNCLIPFLAKKTFMSVIKDLNLDYVRPLQVSHKELAKLANQVNGPIISGVADFYCLNVDHGVINLESFIWDDDCQIKTETSEDNKHYIECYLFDVKDLFDKFPGLTADMLPIFASMFGNDYISADVFEAFVQAKLPNSRKKDLKLGKNRRYRMGRILKWLSAFNGDAVTAVRELKESLDNIPSEVSALDRSMAAFTMKDNDSYLSKLLDMRQKSDEINSQSIITLLNEYDVTNTEGLADHLIGEYFFDSSFDKWLFRMNDCKYQTIYLRVLAEDFNLESCSQSAIDLIRTILGILSDDEKEALLLSKRFEKQMVEEEIWPNTHYNVCKYAKSSSKSLPTFQELADIPMNERQSLFFDLLEVNVKDVNALVGSDAQFWRYFVTIIKYWMSRTKMTEKTDFARALITTAIHYKSPETEKLKSMADLKPKHEDFDVEITHYYNELQVVYHWVDRLHSLLGHPIGRVDLLPYLNGILISRLIKRKDENFFVRTHSLVKLQNNLFDLI